MLKMSESAEITGQTAETSLGKAILNNAAIIIILCIAFAERVLVAKQFGITYNLGNDDLSYVNSAITLVETGQITMHGVLSAQIMPGMPILLAPLVFIFGKGQMLWIAMKCLWMFLGLLSIYGAYRIGLLLDLILKNSKTGLLLSGRAIFTPGRIAGIVASSLMLAIDFAWMDNLILTETPYMFFTIYLVYFSLMLGHYSGESTKYFWGIVGCFVGALFIRPTIAMYPLFLVTYLLIRRYDRKLLIRQLIVAAGVLLLVLTPWTIRNYMQFGQFIPLTYGMGNPLLLGTYQGEGYPEDEFIDYESEVKAKLPEYMGTFARDEPGIQPYMLRYYKLEYDGYKAKYRMKLWWENDSESMLKSYLWLKPKMIMDNSFLWEKTLRSEREDIRAFRHIQWIMSGVSFLFIVLISQIFGKRSRNTNRTDATPCRGSTIWKEINDNAVFLTAVYLSQVYLYAYSFAFERYGQAILFFQFVMIGWGIGVLVRMIARIFKNMTIKLAHKT